MALFGAAVDVLAIGIDEWHPVASLLLSDFDDWGLLVPLNDSHAQLAKLSTTLAIGYERRPATRCFSGTAVCVRFDSKET